MIFDSCQNLEKYGFDLSVIADALRSGKFETGKFEIGREGMYAIGLEYQTKEAQNAVWEAHRKNLDVHCILSGEEYVDISDISIMRPINEYSDDYQLYEGPATQRIHFSPGNFLVLFPHEVHKTSISIGPSEPVKKIVFKIRIDDKEENPDHNRFGGIA